MRKSIHAIEIVLYLIPFAALTLLWLLGLGADQTSSLGLGEWLSAMLAYFFFEALFYGGYLALAPAWRSGSCWTQFFLLGFLPYFLLGDIVRRIAFVFYEGDQPVVLALGPPLVKKRRLVSPSAPEQPSVTREMPPVRPGAQVDGKPAAWAVRRSIRVIESALYVI
jgi:hypothetical protein